MIQDEERKKIISRYLGTLQGLKAIPFGLMLIVLAIQDLGVSWIGAAGDCSFTLPLLLLVFGVLFAIDQYYVNRFGKMRPLSRRSQMQETTIFLSVFALVMVLENWLAPPVSLMGLAVSFIFFLSGANSRRYYYFPLGGVVVLASFMPWVAGTPLNYPTNGSLSATLKVVIGVTIMAAGLIDHFLLERALKMLPETLPENAPKP